MLVTVPPITGRDGLYGGSFPKARLLQNGGDVAP
jgi:hypothetical protein